MCVGFDKKIQVNFDTKSLNPVNKIFLGSGLGNGGNGRGGLGAAVNIKRTGLLQHLS